MSIFRRSLCASVRTPLKTFLAESATQHRLRTAYSHQFRLDGEGDRAAAAAFRERCRSGEFGGPTSGCAPGYVQANLVALPRQHALDFLCFALRNPRACPLLDVTAPGDPRPLTVAPSADLRTDLPKYCVWRDGRMVEEVADVSALWGDDMVGFLLGCSFSWEHGLVEMGHPPRHMEEGRNVPMYQTNVPNARVGPFGGSLVVSMRPYRLEDLPRIVSLTCAYPGAHGGPLHWGAPELLGIDPDALGAPQWGDAVTVRDDEVPVFWACGVTPQLALENARPDIAITHAPGHMLVLDTSDDVQGGGS